MFHVYPYCCCFFSFLLALLFFCCVWFFLLLPCYICCHALFFLSLVVFTLCLFFCALLFSHCALLLSCFMAFAPCCFHVLRLLHLIVFMPCYFCCFHTLLLSLLSCFATLVPCCSHTSCLVVLAPCCTLLSRLVFFVLHLALLMLRLAVIVSCLVNFAFMPCWWRSCALLHFIFVFCSSCVAPCYFCITFCFSHVMPYRSRFHALLLVLSHFVSCVLTPCYCHFFPSFATHALLPYHRCPAITPCCLLLFRYLLTPRPQLLFCYLTTCCRNLINDVLPC